MYVYVVECQYNFVARGPKRYPKGTENKQKNDKNKHEALLYPVGDLLYLSSCELSFPKHLDLVFKDLNRVWSFLFSLSGSELLLQRGGGHQKDVL